MHTSSSSNTYYLCIITRSQDSLILEATADGLSGEQTWPSEAEMNLGDAAAAETIDSAIGRNRRIVPTNVSIQKPHKLLAAIEYNLFICIGIDKRC